jgi:hypothetical protein
MARGDSISLTYYGRATTISTVTGKGHTETLPRGITGFAHLVLAGGALFINTYAMGAPAFVVITPGTDTPARFGPAQPMVELPQQGGRTIPDADATAFALASDGRNGIWAVAHNYRHDILHLAADGRVLNEITREATWFPRYDYAERSEALYRLTEMRTPRPTQAMSVAVDGGEHVLVTYLAADAHWNADPNAPPPPPPAREYPVQHLEPTGGIDRYIDGVLEVYDAGTGAFLGSWRSDTALGNFTQTGLLAHRVQDADGIISFHIYRVVVLPGQ